jgi:outer membrane protein assembly complex protein YaeT
MRARTALTAVAALVAAAILLVLLLHAPFVRRMVLGYILPTVERDYQLQLTASRLDYNLAAMRVGLADVALAAPQTPYEPFFTAAYVQVDLPWSILTGAIVFDDIGVSDGKAVIRRYADGTTNLPSGSDDAGGEPPPLRINGLDINQLSVDVNDEQTVTSLWLPALAIRLTPSDGYIRLDREGFRTELQETAIQRLEGGARFDGRALHVLNLELHTRDVSATLDGVLAFITAAPAVDMAITGTADAARLSRWFVANGDLPEGTVAFTTEVEGTFDDIVTQASLRSDALRWRDVTLTEMRADALVTSREVTLENMTLGFADGVVTAMGVLPIDPAAPGRLSASWKGIDAAAATRAFAAMTAVVPSGVFSGELNVEGTGQSFERWRGLVRFALDGGPETASSGQISARGASMIRLNEGGWHLEGRHVLGGVAPAMVVARGRTDTAGVDATVSVARTDLAALASMFRNADLASIDADVISAGTIEATVSLAGALADPATKAEVVVRDFANSDVRVPLIEAVVSGRPVLPELTFRAEAPVGTIAGEAVTDLSASGRFVDTTLMLHEVRARQPASAGMLQASGTYDMETGEYRAAVEGSGWRVSPTADRPLSATLDVTFDGQGTVDIPVGSGRLTLRDTRWDATEIGPVVASFRLEPASSSSPVATTSIARVHADAPDLRLSAEAHVLVTEPYAATFKATGTEADLSRLLSGVSTTVPVTGTVSFLVQGGGGANDWRNAQGSLEVTALDARVADLSIRRGGATSIQFGDRRLFVDSLELDIEEMRLSASGELDAFAGGSGASGLVVTLTGNVDQVVRAAAAAGVTDLPVTGGTGPVALLAHVTGTAEEPVVAADLEAGPGTITLRDLPPATDLRVRAHAEDGWLELREAQVVYEDARVEATGRAPVSMLGGPGAGSAGPLAAANPAAGPATLQIRATNLNPSVLAPFLEPGSLDDVAGSIDAALDLSTPSLELSDLTGELRVDRLDVRVADLPVTQRVPTRIVARDGFARVEAWEWVGQGATLGVRGQVRLEDRQAAILANGVVDLRMLTPFVREAGMTAAGTLEPRLSITGSIDSPRIDGDVTMTGAEFRLSDPRVVISGVDARMVLSRMTGRITQLTGTINGGSLAGEGSVEYSDDGQIAFEVSTDIRGMALEFPEGLRSELDGMLTITLAAPDPVGGRITGTVTVARGAYREPLAVVTGLLAGIRARQIAAAAEPSPLLDALALDVRIITDDDIYVDNNYGRFQVGGDLRLIGTASAPALSGRAELREGGQLFVGRNVYTVNSGVIDFASSTAIEPILAVEASTRAGGEDIEVTISGPAEGPSVVLSSPTNPELGQAELASLLLTGRRLENLAPGDAAFVGTQVLGNFSAEVLGFASRAVGLDTLRLGGVDNPSIRRDPTAIATELDPTTRVTFGKSIGPDLDVTFSQSLRDSDAQTWIVDYLPARGIELRLVSDDEDLRSYGFRHDLSFGNVTRLAASPAARRLARRVSRIDIAGQLGIPEARVRDVLRLEAGDEFDFASWQEDRDRLEALYRDEGYLTARVEARREDAADGVVLTYNVTAGPVATIELTGMEADAGVRQQLETAWAESVFDDFLLDEAAGIVRTHLAARGYLRPVIKATIRGEAAAKVLALSVEEGPRTVRTTIQVDGAGALTSDVEAALAAADVVDRAIADPASVEDAATVYLRNRGFLRAVVTSGEPRYDGETAILPVTIEAGDAYSVRDVSFAGASGLEVALLREIVAIESGAPYVAATVEEGRQRLVALYRREGFAAATARARPDVDPTAARVLIVFEVVEGPRQTVGEIVVSGNSGVDAEVIEETLRLATGEPLRSEDVLQARTRVFNMGLFRRIDLATEPIESAGTNDTTPMRIRVTVEEWPSARLRYGLVVAEERPEDRLEGRELVPGFSADLTRRTLFGRPVGIGAAVALQRRDQSGRVFVNTPTLFSLPVESSLIAERSREEFQAVSLVTNRNSVTWEQRATPLRNLTISYAYTFERNHTFDTDPNESDPLSFDITINIARMNAAAAWDSRDDPTDPTRGLFASTTTEYAPEAVGSDIRFIRQLQQAYSFRPWRGMVFASAARAGIVIPLGGQDLITSERFFAGGSRTVRGVAEESLGGRDFFGDPTGGQVMLVFNQEVRVPLYRWVRGVGFVDAGNVFARPRDVKASDLVGSVGAGLRVMTPFALLRVDFAKTAWGAEGTSGRWTFGIGHAF